MTGEPRKPNAYILALKEFNKNKSMWCIPKKGSEDHKEVTRMKEKIQKGESVAKKEENVIVHTEKKIEKIEAKHDKQKDEDLYNMANQVISFNDKESWDKSDENYKKRIIRDIIVTYDAISKRLGKPHPFPTMKSLPKYMHAEYKKYKKEHTIK